MIDRWLTPAAVAETLSVSRMTVNRWCRAGILPTFTIGSITRISEQSLEAFIIENTKTPEEPCTLRSARRHRQKLSLIA